MMELARTLVAGGPTGFPAAPVMLLFSGAEEPLCQASCSAVQRRAVRKCACIHYLLVADRGAQ
jgi:hypothetical protein